MPVCRFLGKLKKNKTPLYKENNPMLVLGCLLAIAAAFAPRIVLIIMWIVGPRINAAFESFIVPLLGLIFLPYRTIMYVLVWNPATGVFG